MLTCQSNSHRAILADFSRSLEIIKLMMILILIFSFYSIIILIPINATGHNKYRPENTTLINETEYSNETLNGNSCFCACVLVSSPLKKELLLTNLELQRDNFSCKRNRIDYSIQCL